MTEARSVMVVCGFRTQPGKVETHIQPLAEVCDRTVLVWPNETDASDDIEFVNTSYTDSKTLNLLLMLVVSLTTAIRDDFSLIVTFSLVPYGSIGLLAGGVSRTPVHLGIIGGDLDVHAQGAFGRIVVSLFRRFDVLTVASSTSKERLVARGVDAEKVHIVPHPAREPYYTETSLDEPTYDLLWVGRLSEEKAPLRFVKIVKRLNSDSRNVTAAIVGSGPLEAQVQKAVKGAGLEEEIDVVGWSDEPITYFKRSRIYVLTSEREMVPVSLVEAMLLGVPPVAPRIGGVPDIIEDGDNGVLVPEQDISEYVTRAESLLTDRNLYSRLSSNAPDIESDVSPQSAADRWLRILSTVS